MPRCSPTPPPCGSPSHRFCSSGRGWAGNSGSGWGSSSRAPPPCWAQIFFTTSPSGLAICWPWRPGVFFPASSPRPQFGAGVGDLLALAAGVFYAGYYLATQFGRRHLASLPYVASAGVASSFILLAVVLLIGYPLTGYPPQTWASFIGLGLVTQVLGYVAVGYALGLLPASLVAATMVGQPVVTALLAVPLLGEPLSLVQWVGGAAVLGGILIVHRSHRASIVPAAA